MGTPTPGLPQGNCTAAVTCEPSDRPHPPFPHPRHPAEAVSFRWPSPYKQGWCEPLPWSVTRSLKGRELKGHAGVTSGGMDQGSPSGCRGVMFEGLLERGAYEGWR